MNRSEDNMPDEILADYENMQPLQASTGWEQQLYSRIKEKQRGPSNGKEWLRPAAFIMFFLLLNVFLLTRSGNQNSSTNQRAKTLDTISDQLLINSTALK